MQQSLLQKLTYFILFIFFFIAGLYFAKGFLIPFIISLLLSIVLLPLNKRMEKWGIPRLVAIILSLLVVFAIITGIVFLFYTQIVNLAADLPLIQEKVIEKFGKIQSFIESQTNIPANEQMEWILLRYNDFLESSGQYIRAVLMGVSGAFAIIGLIIIYILFFLLYRERFYLFMLKLAAEANHSKIENIFSKVNSLIQHYLLGLLIELAVLGSLNAVGLLILGIRQAIFLGYLAGLLNIIPYVGSLLGSIFPIIMALVFEDSIMVAVAVLGVMLFNQFIDNNILTPKIIGSQIQLNPLMTIMGIVIGGFLWGIAGMVLFIPLLGVFKIICDNSAHLQPIGFLLGDAPDPKKSNTMKKLSGFLKRRNK